MENIKAILQQASEDYYNGKPTMSDEQFDKLATYAQYDEVGFSSRDNRVPHAFQMYSLQKIFSNSPIPYSADRVHAPLDKHP